MSYSVTTSAISAHAAVLRSRSQMLADGVTDAEIAALLRVGTLQRRRRGTYAPPIQIDEKYEARLAEYIQRVLSHAQAAPACVVSHVSAAPLHGLPVAHSPLQIAHLTRPGRSNGRRRSGVQFHGGSLTPEDIVICDGVRFTSLAKTLVDVARTESMPNAVAIADAALRGGGVEPAAVRAALERAAHCCGMPQARRALAFVDGRSESVGESFARVAFAAAGLPPPELQVEVRAPNGSFLARCDFGYPGFAVLIEFDGMTKYNRLRRPGESVEQTVLREKAREDRLREAGFVVVRLTWRDLDDPVALARRILSAIDLGKRSVAAGLVTGLCAVPLALPALV